MASIITSSSPSYCPQVRLDYSVKSSTDINVTFHWELYYVTHGYALNTDGAGRAWSVKIDGSSAKSGSYNINGLGGSTSRLISSGDYTVTRYSKARDVPFSLSFNFNATFSGTSLGTRTASGTYNIAATTSYTVSYNANGGSGAPSAQTKWHSVSLTLSTTKPTRTGYTFVDWVATNGTHYNPGDSFTQNNNSTLTAQWKKITYTVSYNANGGSGAPSSQTKTYGTNLTLSSTKPTRTGYTFDGWATSSSGSVAYQPGGTYSANSAVTLYAKWTLITYKVTYNANGGSGAPGQQTKNYGQTLTLSSTKPTKSNYNFVGWAKTSSGSVTYQPGSAYTGNADLTLYAIWELASTAPTITNFSISRKRPYEQSVNGVKNTFNLETGEYDAPIYAIDLGFGIGDLGGLSSHHASDGTFYWKWTSNTFSAAVLPETDNDVANISMGGYDTVSANALVGGGYTQAIALTTDGDLLFTIPDTPVSPIGPWFAAKFNKTYLYYELANGSPTMPLAYLLGDYSNIYLVDDPMDGNVALVTFDYSFDQSAGTNYGQDIYYTISSKSGTIYLDDAHYRYDSSTIGKITFAVFPVTSLVDSVLHLTVVDNNGLSTNKQIRLYSGRYYVDYYDDPEGDVGVAVGMPASQSGFHVNPITQFHKSVYIQQDDPATECDLYFATGEGGTRTHKTSIYGGDSESLTALGAWDNKNGRRIWNYQDEANIIFFGDDPRIYRTAIPQNANLNDYLAPGHYVCGANTTVGTLSNLPSGLSKAFQMDVINTLNVTSKTTAYMKAVLTDYFGNRWINVKNDSWGGWKRIMWYNDLRSAVRPCLEYYTITNQKYSITTTLSLVATLTIGDSGKMKLISVNHAYTDKKPMEIAWGPGSSSNISGVTAAPSSGTPHPLQVIGMTTEDTIKIYAKAASAASNNISVYAVPLGN